MTHRFLQTSWSLFLNVVFSHANHHCMSILKTIASSSWKEAVLAGEATEEGKVRAPGERPVSAAPKAVLTIRSPASTETQSSPIWLV